MKRIVAYILTVMCFSSCMKSSESGSFVPYPETDTAWVRTGTGLIAIAADSLFNMGASEVGTVNANKFDTIYLSEGTSVCTKPGFCKYTDGRAVEGDVQIRLLQLNSRGDYIRYGKPTVSKNKILHQPAAFRLKIMKDNKLLAIAKDSAVHIRYRSTLTEKMTVFTGDTALYNPSNFRWDATEDTSSFYTETNSQPYHYGYRFPCSKQGWISIGRETGSNNTTKVTVVSPVIFTNANTAVFAALSGQLTVIRMTPDPGSRSFYATDIPVGIPIQLISISRLSNGKLYFGREPIVVDKDGAIVKLKPAETTLGELSNILNYL